MATREESTGSNQERANGRCSDLLVGTFLQSAQDTERVLCKPAALGAAPFFRAVSASVRSAVPGENEHKPKG